MQHHIPSTRSLLMALLAGCLGIAALPARASDGFRNIDTNAVLGGALGGGAGAAVGSAVGGRNGAILGSAVGAAAGVAIATPQRSYNVREYDDDYRHDNGWHRGHHKHGHHHDD